MVVVDGIVKALNVCETPTDLTGDSVPEKSFADQILKDLKKIERVILCSGKVYYDLLEERRARKLKNVYLMRVEQL